MHICRGARLMDTARTAVFLPDVCSGSSIRFSTASKQERVEGNGIHTLSEAIDAFV